MMLQKIYTTAIIFVVILFGTDAQKLTYGDGTINYEDEDISTILVTLDPKPELLEDKFEKWMRKNYDVNLKEKSLLFFEKEYMSAKGVVIPAVSDRKLDLIVKVDESDNDFTKMNVFASYGYNSWIQPTTHPYEWSILEDIVYEFVEKYLPEYYFEELDEAKENLADLKDDNEDLNDDLEDNRKEIAALQQKNKALMSEIKSNQMAIVRAKTSVKVKKKEYETIKNKVKKNR